MGSDSSDAWSSRIAVDATDVLHSMMNGVMRTAPAHYRVKSVSRVRVTQRQLFGTDSKSIDYALVHVDVNAYDMMRRHWYYR